MTKLAPAFILLLFIFPCFAQHKTRTIEELINTEEPGWPLVRQWIDSAKNKVEILSCDLAKANDALVKTQVTKRSPMGSIIYSTGGLSIDVNKNSRSAIHVEEQYSFNMSTRKQLGLD